MARGRALAHPVPARQTDFAIQIHGMNPRQSVFPMWNSAAKITAASRHILHDFNVTLGLDVSLTVHFCTNVVGTLDAWKHQNPCWSKVADIDG